MNLLNGYSHSNYIKHKSRLLKSNAPCSPLKAEDQYLGFTLALLQKALAAMWLFLHVGESYSSCWCQIQTHTCREQWSACSKDQIIIIIPTGMQAGHQTTKSVPYTQWESPLFRAGESLCMPGIPAAEDIHLDGLRENQHLHVYIYKHPLKSCPC